MRNDTQATSADSPARQIAFYFGAIANTLDWTHDQWLALNARLQVSGAPIGELTLHQVHVVIQATVRGSHKAGA